MVSKNNEFLDRAYALQSVQDAVTLYDEWSSTYDKDMVDMEYLSPQLVADPILHYGDIKSPILDAGCGTGLVGVALSKLGSTIVDGVDISPGMLNAARNTGYYRKLEIADLTKPLAFPDASYGAVVCSGTLTHGHVGPAVLAEFVRVTRTDGVIAATVIGDMWETHGFRAKVESLAEAKLVEIISTDNAEYRKARGVYVRLVVLRRL